MRKRFRLKNLDCASCAANIESNLKKLGSVRDVSVSFATLTMEVETDNIEEVLRVIKRVEPNVEVVDLREKRKRETDEGDDFHKKKELSFILASTILFVLGLVFRERLHILPYSIGEYVVFLSAYLLSGWMVLKSAGRNVLRGKFFDEYSLMSIATLGAIVIHELPEAVGVMLFFKVGEFFQDLSLSRSRRSIRSLLEIRPDYANLKTDGKIEKVSPEEVGVGATIVVKPGEKIPLDGEVISGTSLVDTSALTGESVPRKVRLGDPVLAGMISKAGMLTIKVTRPFGESSISRILDLVENASSKKAETEKFITRFAKYYTPFVVSVAVGVAIFPPLLTGAAFSAWIYRALVLLVISCPCALVISIPLGYFGGIGGASRRGILVKGSNFLDALTQVKTVVFDKTGTLTKGVFKVTQIVPKNGFNKEELLSFAALAESQSNHPIAQSILEAYGDKVNPSSVEEYQEISGFGVRAKVKGRIVLAGNDRLLHREKIEHDSCDVEGTVVHVTVDGVYAGYIVISDEIRDDAPEAVGSLRALGVKKIMMLTGDSDVIAKRVSERLGLDSYLSQLLPEEKVSAIEKLMEQREGKEKVAFVGDGINDAPVIARSDVGVAMGGLGSDAAIDTADVVIMTDAPSKVADAIKVGRKTRKIVWQNITFALSVKGAFILFGIAGMATMWQAVFADVGVALIAIFNATRVLR